MPFHLSDRSAALAAAFELPGASGRAAVGLRVHELWLGGRALAAEELLALVTGYSPGMNEASAQKKVLEKFVAGLPPRKEGVQPAAFGQKIIGRARWP
jgi:hypothetical protein